MSTEHSLRFNSPYIAWHCCNQPKTDNRLSLLIASFLFELIESFYAYIQKGVLDVSDI